MNCFLELLRDVFQSNVSITKLVLEVRILNFCMDEFLLFANLFSLILLKLRGFLFITTSWIVRVNQALKIESGFIGLMTIFSFISIIPLCSVLIWSCSSDKRPPARLAHRSSFDDDIQPNIALDDHIDSTFCCRRILQFLLQILTLFLM